MNEVWWRMMIDEWRMMKDEWWRMLISSCWGVLLTDGQTNEQTFVIVESLSRLKMIKCLHQICEKTIIETILHHFQYQKSINGKWVLSISDWLKLLGKEEVKSWLSCLPLFSVESLLRQGMTLLGEAHNKDTLLGLMTLCMELGIKTIVMPSYLVLDESSRYGGRTFYMLFTPTLNIHQLHIYFIYLRS